MASVEEKYRRRADRFGHLVAEVSAEQWENPSPCEEWAVGELFAHVIDMHSVMLRPLDRASEISFSTDENPLEQFQNARSLIEAILADPQLSQVETDIPGEGPGPLEREIDTVLGHDLVIHNWDLAVAVDLDCTMHSDDVAELWQRFSLIPADLMEQFRIPEAFGPGVTVFGSEVEVSANASLQDRLLGFIGRDPQWGKRL